MRVDNYNEANFEVRHGQPARPTPRRLQKNVSLTLVGKSYGLRLEKLSMNAGIWYAVTDLALRHGFGFRIDGLEPSEAKQFVEAARRGVQAGEAAAWDDEAVQKMYAALEFVSRGRPVVIEERRIL